MTRHLKLKTALLGLGLGLFVMGLWGCGGCQKDYERAANIDAISLETGTELNQFLFFARFKNKEGVMIKTKGTLEVVCLQKGRAFFKKTLEVDPDEFKQYGKKYTQFRSEPIIQSEFLFDPQYNDVGWFDHTIKATFKGVEGETLSFEKSFTFKKSEINRPKAALKD